MYIIDYLDYLVNHKKPALKAGFKIYSKQPFKQEEVLVK